MLASLDGKYDTKSKTFNLEVSDMHTGKLKLMTEFRFLPGCALHIVFNRCCTVRSGTLCKIYLPIGRETVQTPGDIICHLIVERDVAHSKRFVVFLTRPLRLVQALVHL